MNDVAVCGHEAETRAGSFETGSELDKGNPLQTRRAGTLKTEEGNTMGVFLETPFPHRKTPYKTNDATARFGESCRQNHPGKGVTKLPRWHRERT